MSKDYLEHHGVLGQKWGVRRYQNKDGSLTAAGKRRVYAQGANYGGYESFRHRNRRAIDAAKYEKDIKRNQKKLDRAYEKGNEKKIAKYTNIDKMLKNNRDIMTKDLSPEMIQMGRDYLTTMKAVAIGTIIAGPIGGVSAGTGVRYANKMPENEKKVYAQEAERKRLAGEIDKARKAENDWAKVHGREPYEGELAKEGDRLIENSIKARDALNNYDADQARRAGVRSNVKVYRDTDDSDGGESSARAAAKNAGLDQGDNWKMYRDAQHGDKEAQKVVDKWEKKKRMHTKNTKKS